MNFSVEPEDDREECCSLNSLYVQPNLEKPVLLLPYPSEISTKQRISPGQNGSEKLLRSYNELLITNLSLLSRRLTRFFPLLYHRTRFRRGLIICILSDIFPRRHSRYGPRRGPEGKIPAYNEIDLTEAATWIERGWRKRPRAEVLKTWKLCLPGAFCISIAYKSGI